MYHNLGIHWASCVPAFLSLACVPFPFIFYHYGPSIRRKCKYAAEADDFMRALAQKAHSGDPVKEKPAEAITDADAEQVSIEESQGRGSIDSYSTLERTGTTYEANPYDIDRINTRNSAITQRSKSFKSSKWRLSGSGHKTG